MRTPAGITLAMRMAISHSSDELDRRGDDQKDHDEREPAEPLSAHGTSCLVVSEDERREDSRKRDLDDDEMAEGRHAPLAMQEVIDAHAARPQVDDAGGCQDSQRGPRQDPESLAEVP